MRSAALKIKEVSAPIKGLHLNVPGSDIEDLQMTNCQSMIIDTRTGVIRKEDGYISKGSNLPLNGAITGIDQYYLINGNSKLIVGSIYDVYYWDNITGTWKTITRKYSTGSGSLTLTNNSKVITGTGTAWNTSGLVHGDKIGFQTTDMNAVTTWYTIDTVDSATQITMTAIYTNTTGTGQSYVARHLYAGDPNYLWYMETMSDLHILTNYLDPIQMYDNTNPLVPLGGSPPRARFLKKFKDYLILGFTNDGTAYPQRVQWCDTGNPQSWTVGVTNAGFQDLVEGVDWIMGFAIIQDNIVILKERSIYTGYLTGNTDIFNFNIRVEGIGCAASATIQELGDEVIFLGWDGVYAFNGFTVTDVSADIRNELINTISPGLIGNSHAHLIEERDEYHLFVPSSTSSYPDQEFIYNYVKKAWTRGPALNITKAGFYTKQATSTWNTMVGTWDQQTARWDDRTFLDNAPTNLFGDSGGYIYENDYSLNNRNGVAIDAYFDSKDWILDNWDIQKYFCRLDLFARGDSVSVYYSLDEGRTWILLETKTLDTNNFLQYKFDFRISADKIRFRFRNPNLNESLYIRRYLLYFGPGGRLPL